MKHILFYPVIVVVMLASCKYGLNTKVSTTYKIEESVFVDSVTADFPVEFSSVSYNDQQFIAYYNKNRNLAVASRNISDSTWERKVLPTRVGWDSHNSIVMTLDRNNCIHLAGNMHNDSLYYFVSEKPLDISTLERVFPQVSVEDELRCTYPRFFKSPDGKLVFTYRKGGSGNGVNIINAYDEATKSFSRLTDKPLFDGLDEMSAYFSGPRLGPDGWYHVTWVWRNTPGCETNHDLSYARSKDLVNWENVKGQNVELPITPRNSLFTVDPVPPGGGVINGAFRLIFDKSNLPLLVYMKYDEVGNNQLFVAKTNGELWKIKQVSNWKTRWEFSGSGSINFQIRIKGATVTDNEKIEIDYWHKDRGNGQLVVDLTSLELLEDTKVKSLAKSEYPEELSEPVSKMEGMQVRWMKIRSNTDSKNSYYLARWETLGKHRFYEPTDIPVKPAALCVYKISEQ